jgi:hypothetical protein
MILLLRCPKCDKGIWGCEDTLFRTKKACPCSEWGETIVNSCYYRINNYTEKKHLCPECFEKENRYWKLRL